MQLDTWTIRPNLIFPILLFPSWESSYHIQKCLVVSFDLSVAHWMIWSCVRTFDVTQSEQFFDDIGFKIPPLITIEVWWKSILTNELDEEGVCGCLCSWLWVRTAIAYLVKWSVMTKMLYLTLDSSTLRNSIQISAKGGLVVMETIPVVCCVAFLCMHLSNFWDDFLHLYPCQTNRIVSGSNPMSSPDPSQIASLWWPNVEPTKKNSWPNVGSLRWLLDGMSASPTLAPWQHYMECGWPNVGPSTVSCI